MARNRRGPIPWNPKIDPVSWKHVVELPSDRAGGDQHELVVGRDAAAKAVEGLHGEHAMQGKRARDCQLIVPSCWRDSTQVKQ